MGALVTLVVVGSVAGGMISVGLAAVAWHYREVPAALPFGLLVLAIGGWSFANAALITSETVTAAYIADRVVRSLLIQVPPIGFVFVLFYTGREDWVTSRRIAALWAYPMLYVLASVTAPLHGFMTTPEEVRILTTAGITAPHVPSGPGFVPSMIYSFAVAGVALAVLVGFIFRSRSAYRNQTAILAVGGFLGVGTSLLDQLGVVGHPGVDITPISTVIVGTAIGLALVRYDFLRLMPMAEDVVVDELPDPVFVLDEDGEVVDFNPAAEGAFEQDEPSGEELEAIAPGLAAHLEEASIFRWTEAGNGAGVTYYEPSVTPLEDQYGTARGRLVMLREITGQKRRQDRLEALQEATRRFLRASTDDQIAEIAVDYAERTLDCEAAGVLLADDDGTLRPAATTENATDLFEDDELVIGPDDGFAAYDAYESGELVELELSADVGGPLERLVFLPLGDLGILATGSTGSVGFDSSDEGFATILTRTTQVALNRVERESELRQSRKALEQRTEQIAFFNGVLRHSLRNALLVIEGRADHLRGSLSDAEAEHVDTILQWCEDLAHLNEEISSVNETVTASESERLAAVNLSELLGGRLEAYEERYPDATFSVDVAGDLAVRADELARSVLDSVVDNAIVHNDSETPRVEIWTVEAADRVQVHVADNGPGVTDEMKAIVFQRSVSTDQTASGFGLHFVSVLMNLYGGNLRFEDNDPEGTVAVLEFQQATGGEGSPDDGVVGAVGTPSDPGSSEAIDAGEIPEGEGIDPTEGLDGPVDGSTEGEGGGQGTDDAGGDPPEA